MILLKHIYYIFIENIICRVKGHQYKITKDIKTDNINIPFDGAQVLHCERCHRTKIAWYIDNKE